MFYSSWCGIRLPHYTVVMLQINDTSKNHSKALSQLKSYTNKLVNIQLAIQNQLAEVFLILQCGSELLTLRHGPQRLLQNTGYITQHKGNLRKKNKKGEHLYKRDIYSEVRMIYVSWTCWKVWRVRHFSSLDRSSHIKEWSASSNVGPNSSGKTFWKAATSSPSDLVFTKHEEKHIMADVKTQIQVKCDDAFSPTMTLTWKKYSLFSGFIIMFLTRSTKFEFGTSVSVAPSCEAQHEHQKDLQLYDINLIFS